MSIIQNVKGPNSQEQRVLGDCAIHPKQGGEPDLTGIKSVLELGNKTTPEGVPFRNWYIARGLSYVSVDWNGQHEALKRDLNQTIIPESIGGPFDLVTNFGTTEHVSDQLACWQNVHSFVKVGGKLASHTPIGPNWDHHGFWHPSLEWYQEFADLNNYVVERLDIEDFGGRDYRDVTCIRLRKIQDLPFTMPSTPITRSPKQFDQEVQYI